MLPIPCPNRNPLTLALTGKEGGAGVPWRQKLNWPEEMPAKGVLTVEFVQVGILEALSYGTKHPFPMVSFP